MRDVWRYERVISSRNQRRAANTNKILDEDKLQNTTQKTKDWATRTMPKKRMNLGALEW